MQSICVDYWRTICSHNKMFLFTNIEHVITILSTVKIHDNIGHRYTCILLVMIINMNFKRKI